MADWVVTLTFDADPSIDRMTAWESELESWAGWDASVARIPGRGVAVTLYAPGEMRVVDVVSKTVDEVAPVIGAPLVGVEVVTEAEHARRADEPSLPELMSAADIAVELGVARQRVHQLRSTAAFPAPLAELGGGAVWDAAAVRKFARGWTRKPGRPRVAAPAVTVSARRG